IFGNCNKSAVEESPVTANAPYAAPGPGSKKGAQVVLPEVKGEDVSIRGRIVIDETHLRSIEDLLGGRKRHLVPIGRHTDQDSSETLKNDLVNESATVPTVIDDQSLLVHLGIKLA